jgi:sorbitol/mannitol transport system substrate-binding protein
VLKALLLGLGVAAVAAAPVYAGSITVASVNNPDMAVMEQLLPYFTKLHPDIHVHFVTLPDQVLRQTVTQDLAVGGGRYDLATISPYEVQSGWAKNNWLVPLNPLFAAMPPAESASYDLADIIPTIRASLTVNGQLYALPFYGESSFTMYRADLLKAKGLTMPANPTWDDVRSIACAVKDPSAGVYGIVMKGTPEYGQLAPFMTLMHSFGASWFDEKWQPQMTSPAFRKAFHFYVTLLHDCGEPGASSVGFNEALTLMAQGRAAIWVDATVAAGLLEDPKFSKVSGKLGFAAAPTEGSTNGSAWLYTWALGILSSSRHQKDAFTFATWATSKSYIDLVASKIGVLRIPSGTRVSTYQRSDYLAQASFAPQVLKAIEVADLTHPAKNPVPYTGTAQVDMPEYGSWAATFGKDFSAVTAGQMTEDQALTDSQAATEKVMHDAGYLK